MEDSISQQVARALLLELTGSEKQRMARHYTENREAYEDYLKGLRKGIAFFQQAIAKDPSYAQAYAGLADCYLLLGFYGFLPPEKSYPKAEATAIKALQIDDTLAEAHASLLSAKTDYD